MKPAPKIIKTEDGSHSLYISELDETYHSSHGAIQESSHVYIQAGLAYCIENNPDLTCLKVLEFGFGTGLNALLAAQTSRNSKAILYHTLEKYPLPVEITNTLNLGELLNDKALFEKIHNTEWEKEQEVINSFSIKKIKDDFRSFIANESYHLIFFDAFAPSKQPDLWDRVMLEKCYKFLVSGGVLTTYSAKGQFKRDLKAIGFDVESLPGPPGKFEITRAIKR